MWSLRQAFRAGEGDAGFNFSKFFVDFFPHSQLANAVPRWWCQATVASRQPRHATSMRSFVVMYAKVYGSGHHGDMRHLLTY